jgi:hypothetical protein
MQVPPRFPWVLFGPRFLALVLAMRGGGLSLGYGTLNQALAQSK